MLPGNVLDELRDLYGTDELAAPVLTADEERDYLEIIHLGCDGDDHTECHDCAARDEFIQRNMRLVLHVVKRFMSLQDPRVMDAVSAGVLGLIRGVDRFNIHACNSQGRPFRFSTYAVWWIRSFVHEELRRYEKKIIGHTSYHTQFGKAEKELGCLTGDSEVEQFAVLTYLKDQHGWTDKKISRYLADADNHLVPVESISDPPLEDHEPVRRLLREETTDLVNAALSQLSFQEVYLLMSHYVDGQTYDQIKSAFNVSRERVRQIENEALRKLFVALSPDLGTS